MGGLGSPCGGCKFLRRKCAKGCVFAPYFCYEDAASHFATIHKIFGASNFSKLLSNLPLHDRSYAAVTITYQAQSRLRDPIYGCVSHIFSLQQQVVSLQAQLVLLREEASTRFLQEDCTGPTPGCNLMQQDSQSLFHQGCSDSDRGQMSCAADVLAVHGVAATFMARNESFCSSNESLYYQEVMFPWSVSDYKM